MGRKSKAATSLGDLLESWGRKLKNEPPRRTPEEEELKKFEERSKALAEAARIKNSLEQDYPIRFIDYDSYYRILKEKFSIKRPTAEAMLKEYYDNDPRVYLNAYYSKKYPKGSSVVNDNVETPNTEPLSAPLKNEPIRNETLTDVPLKNELPELDASINATEAVIPGAEAINATARATNEVPKDPSSARILKNALNKFRKDSSNKGLDPKDPKVIGETLKITAPGTIVGGASGEFVTDDEAPWQTHLRNILTGAALGTGGKIAYHQLRPKMPSKGKILKYGAKLGTIGGGLYYKENIKDYANNLWNSTTSKPEDTSPPKGTPLGTPTNTNVNTNTNTNKKRW